MEIEGQYHNVYVIKRPGVDQFMKRMGELYEVVVFTASVSKVSYPELSNPKLGADRNQYGDPLLDQLDIHHVVHHRLFRESCYNHQGNYVKVRHILSSMLHCSKPRIGLVTSWPRTKRHHYYRQLPHILHLPPATRRANQLMVQRCS